jgi:limonene-1,2-epoxide hydrolase
MSPDEIVTAFCTTLTNDGIEASLKYIADDCVYQNMPFDPVVGPAGVRDVLAGFFEVTGQVRIETLKQIAVGEYVTNERLDYFEPPKGKKFGLPVAGAFVVRDGKIVEWRDYFCVKQFSEGTGISF